MASIMIKENSMFPEILFLSPGYKPVPDVAGGAVEHLMTQLIEQNEKDPHFHFELVTVRDSRIIQEKFLHTHICQIKDFRKTFFLRSFSFIVNLVFTAFHTNLRFSYLGLKAYKHLPDDTSFILIENDVNIFKQIKHLAPKKKIIFHMHNDFDTFGEMQKNSRTMKYVLENSTQIWTVSAYLKRHLLSAFGEKYDCKIRVFENCIDRNRFAKDSISPQKIIDFKAKYGIKENELVILYSGRILKQKGILELIEAVKLLPDSIPFKLVIAGDIGAAPKEYRIYLEKAGKHLGEKIVFTGYVSQYEIQTAYAVSDIVAIPSQWQEAFCLTALEASCCGKPCVASISGGLVDVLDESCAKLIPLGNGFIDKFANALDELLSDKNLCIQMGINAEKRAMLFPDESQYFHSFCELSHKVIEG